MYHGSIGSVMSKTVCLRSSSLPVSGIRPCGEDDHTHTRLAKFSRDKVRFSTTGDRKFELGLRVRFDFAF